MTQPIAIVGHAGVFPQAGDTDALWSLLSEGTDAAAEVPPDRWPVPPRAVYDPTPGRPGRVYSIRGCFVEGFTLDRTGLALSEAEASRLDPATALAVHAGAAAWQGTRSDAVDPRRVGVVLGNIVLPTDAASALSEWVLGRTHTAAVFGDAQPPDVTACAPSPRARHAAAEPAGALAQALGLGGERLCLDAACASSLFALHLAVQALRSGRADAMLTGGVSRPDCLYTQMGFSQLRALSASGRCAPFDRGGDGLVVGEGAGVLVLKRLSDAQAHGDRIWAIVRGVGLSNDVDGNLLAPSTDGQLRAMRSAYDAAGFGPSAVDYIECHATGTPVGDAVEFASLCRLREGERACPLGAVKANVGHLLTGAGAVSLIKMLLAMERGQIPPVANFAAAGPRIGLDGAPVRIPRALEDWPDREGAPRRGAVSGFGFGGTNAHVLLEDARGAGARRSQVAVPPLHAAQRTDAAVVGIAAHVGPWTDVLALRSIWIGGEPSTRQPTSKQHFAGLESAAEGWCIDALDVDTARYRIPPRELEELLPQQLLVLEVATAALRDAGLETLESSRAGCVVGLGLDFGTTDYHLRWSVRAQAESWAAALGVTDDLAAWTDALCDGLGPALRPNQVLGGLGSVAASRVARELGIGGPSYVVATGGTSGLAALQIAARAIEAGELDVAVVAAVDLGLDPRAHFAALALGRTATPAEGAAAVILRRADAGGRIYASVVSTNEDQTGVDLELEGGELELGEARGLLCVVQACLRLHHRVLPDAAEDTAVRAWLRDRADGPRRVAIRDRSAIGDVRHVVLQEEGAPVSCPPPPAEALFVVEGDDRGQLADQLRSLAAESIDDVHRHARQWARERRRPDAARGLGFVASSPTDARDVARRAADALERGEDPTRVAVGRVFYADAPVRGELAFVFPGSGSHTPGMGRALALAFPEVLWRQDAETQRLASQLRPELAWQRAPEEMHTDVRGLILAQVAYGTLASDVLREFGVRPRAALGYSLGETAALFALGAWTARDEMLQRVDASDLFTEQLAGRLRAPAATWGVDAARWQVGVVEAGPDAVDAALRPRAYRLIVNTPSACVIGGDPAALAATVQALGVDLRPLHGISAVHCEVVRPVEAAYWALHRLPTHPVDDVRFYSGAWGEAYRPDTERCAAAITDAALHGIDFPRVVRAAYEDGARIFVELGPGSSCTAMLRAILGEGGGGHGDRVVTRSLAAPDGRAGVLRTLAMLIAERAHVDLERLGARHGATETELVAASGRETTSPRDATRPILRIPVGRRAPTIPSRRAAAPQPEAAATAIPAAIDRAGCLEFASGRIAAVLGPRFAEIDALPTRVRLPEEPLMLVDRITQIDGAPLSLSGGRVVTEHDVHAQRWYLDDGRIPTCVAVEAGQADLFLCAYLGIDLQTRGEAVYRLLDATVEFHDALPAVGQTIRYDIRIERFFEHGDTWMFRFRFDATVDGVPLLTMRDGCAGFFTAQQLQEGKGIVRPRAQPPGPTAPHVPVLAPDAGPTALGPTQLAALRGGDLRGAFGSGFTALGRGRPLTLPAGDKLRLVHRVTDLELTGGAHGRGFVGAEADIAADDWFLTCHFKDDQVMPGTLMYECCLHSLRILLLRRGVVGEAGEVAFEPVPGVRSRLVCRGQVLASTKTVRYEVTVREVGYRPEPYAIADAAMFADGKRIVDIHDMSLQLRGSSQAELERLWPQRASGRREPAVAMDRAGLLAFAQGKPSDAFGPRYRVFDEQRQIARLPAPPLAFVDRVVSVSAPAFEFRADVEAVAEVDASTFAWSLAANRQSQPAFAVLLEIALQPCGFLAAHIGSALQSDTDLRFRNLGGEAVLHRAVTPSDVVLRTRARVTNISHSAGMIIQHFEFEVTAGNEPVYSGTTYFGFFTAEALATQVGLRDAPIVEPTPAMRARGKVLDLPDVAPLPTPTLRMVERIDLLDPQGFVEGSCAVDPQAWFFAAHFVQDPVWPGSLGLEGFLQLLKAFALDRWDLGANARFATFTVGQRHRWTYRGQITQAAARVRMQAQVTAIDDDRRRLVADGVLLVDGRPIYRMHDFGLEVAP